MAHSLSRFVLIAGLGAALAGSAGCGEGGNAATALPSPAPSSAVTSAAAAVAASVTAPAAASPTARPPLAATAAPQLAEATHAPYTPASAPSAPAPAPTQTPRSSPAEQSIIIVAKGVMFSPTSLAVAAGSVVHVTFDNEDAGVDHDITFFDAAGARVAATDAAPGPRQQALTFTVGAPQRYVFKCSVHPQTMVGALSVG